MEDDILNPENCKKSPTFALNTSSWERKGAGRGRGIEYFEEEEEEQVKREKEEEEEENKRRRRRRRRRR